MEYRAEKKMVFETKSHVSHGKYSPFFMKGMYAIKFSFRNRGGSSLTQSVEGQKALTAKKFCVKPLSSTALYSYRNI